MKVAGDFAARVRVVLSATNESPVDESVADLGALAVMDALADVDGVAVGDFSRDGFAVAEDCAMVGSGAAEAFTAGAGDCTAVAAGDGFDDAAEFGAEPWER